MDPAAPPPPPAPPVAPDGPETERDTEAEASPPNGLGPDSGAVPAISPGPPPSEPMSAPFLLWHPLYHEGGIARPRGGSGMLTQALARSDLRSAGVPRPAVSTAARSGAGAGSPGVSRCRPGAE